MRLAWTLAAVMLIVVTAGCGGADDAAKSDSRSTSTVSSTSSEPPPEPSSRSSTTTRAPTATTIPSASGGELHGRETLWDNPSLFCSDARGNTESIFAELAGDDSITGAIDTAATVYRLIGCNEPALACDYFMHQWALDLIEAETIDDCPQAFRDWIGPAFGDETYLWAIPSEESASPGLVEGQISFDSTKLGVDVSQSVGVDVFLRWTPESDRWMVVDL